MNLTVLIVDDEPIARRRLMRLLRQMDGVTPVGEAGDTDEAVKAVRDLAPDVVLMDIQMPGGGGFTAIEALGPDAPVVVFVTAHDRYALRAFDIAAVDYVTKPVEFARLALAMNRAKAAAAAKDRNEQIDELQSTVRNLRGALLDATRPMRSIWIKSQSEMRNIEIDAISHIQAERDYVRIHVGGKAYLHNDTLTGMEEKLAHHGFLRVHRSYIVQRRAVVAITRQSRTGLSLSLADGSQIPIGRSYVASVSAELRMGHD